MASDFGRPNSNLTPNNRSVTTHPDMVEISVSVVGALWAQKAQLYEMSNNVSKKKFDERAANSEYH